jgi:hypothetical protein
MLTPSDRSPRAVAFYPHCMAAEFHCGGLCFATVPVAAALCLVERQALRGLVTACEPRLKGRQASPHKEATVLEQEKRRLRHEVARQQALVRAGQRVMGLAARPFWNQPIPAEHGCHFGSGGVGPFCSRLRTERMTTAIAMLLAAMAISALLIFSPSEINAQKLSTKSKIDIPISTNPQINCQRRLLC